MGSWSTKVLKGGSPEPWILVYGGRARAWRRKLEWAGPGRSGYRPDGGSGVGRGDIFPALSLPAIMVASHGAGSEFPTADGSVNVPPQTNYEKENMMIQMVQPKKIVAHLSSAYSQVSI